MITKSKVKIVHLLFASSILFCTLSWDICECLAYPYLAEDRRTGTFVIGNDRFPASLLDLPCVVESYKTYDDSALVKTADVGQVLSLLLFFILIQLYKVASLLIWSY